MSLAYLIPVLNRPRAVAPLLDFIAMSTPDARVVFLTDEDDEPEHAAIIDNFDRMRTACPSLVIDVFSCGGTYAEKINYAVRHVPEPLLFFGADDLEPCVGWFDAAKQHLRGDVQVVGVNDTLRRRRIHATHFLVTADYAAQATIDGGRGPLCEEYAHNFVDDEFIATATHRGVYAYAPDAQVVHRHPMVRSAPDDATYRKGRATYEADRVTFRKREALWM